MLAIDIETARRFIFGKQGLRPRHTSRLAQPMDSHLLWHTFREYIRRQGYDDIGSCAKGPPL